MLCIAVTLSTFWVMVRVQENIWTTTCVLNRPSHRLGWSYLKMKINLLNIFCLFRFPLPGCRSLPEHHDIEGCERDHRQPTGVQVEQLCPEGWGRAGESPEGELSPAEEDWWTGQATHQTTRLGQEQTAGGGWRVCSAYGLFFLLSYIFMLLVCAFIMHMQCYYGFTFHWSWTLFFCLDCFRGSFPWRRCGRETISSCLLKSRSCRLWDNSWQPEEERLVHTACNIEADRESESSTSN